MRPRLQVRPGSWSRGNAAAANLREPERRAISLSLPHGMIFVRGFFRSLPLRPVDHHLPKVRFSSFVVVVVAGLCLPFLGRARTGFVVSSSCFFVVVVLGITASSQALNRRKKIGIASNSRRELLVRRGAVQWFKDVEAFKIGFCCCSA